jgi:hypothetical protein
VTQLEILAEPFVRGEIDKAEFEEKRQVIAGLREEAPSEDSRKGLPLLISRRDD